MGNLNVVLIDKTEEHVESRDEEFRRNRKVAIYISDRPECSAANCVKCARNGKRTLSADDLIYLLVTSAPGTPPIIQGTFHLVAKDAKRGSILVHSAHAKGVTLGSSVQIDARHATADDCIDWLSRNPDPEREALGHMLNVARDCAKTALRAAS